MNLKRPNFKKLRIKETNNICKKVYFGTKEIADAFIKKRSGEKNARPATSYLCHKCNCWHLTSWDAPDVQKWIKELQLEIDEIEAEYQAQFDKDFEHFEFCHTQVRIVAIERNNLFLENTKLKKELELIKFLNKS